MNYTLNQLQIFLKITQTQSITKAAEELHLTQPAVSIQLKNFQDQFDIPLTEVVRRKIYITDFGKEIAETAEGILNQIAAINYKTHSFKGQFTGRLRFSISSTGKYVMPYFLAPFMKQHANLDLVMEVSNRSQVVENLTKNAVDFALLSFLPSAPAVEKLDLLENKFFLVGNFEEKFKKTHYPKSALKDMPLIFREKGSEARQVMENFISTNKIGVLPKMELTSNEAVTQAVVAGLGYSIMPHIGIKAELKSNQLQIIPVSGLPIKTTWRLVWLKGKRHSPVAAAFLDFMKAEKVAIIDKHFAFGHDL